MQVTDDMVEAAAKKLYEMRHLTRWEALGERSQDIYLIEARAMLRTAAALSDKQAGEVKIKPLEWVDADEGMCTKWRAAALGGHYELVDFGKDDPGFAVNFHWGRPLSFWFIQGEPDELGPTGPKMFPILEAAKAAAQTDYEQRIRSALVDVPAVEPVAWMDDGTCRAGSDSSAHRVVTDAQKRDMPEAIASSFTTPLFASPPLSREGEDSAEVFRSALQRISELTPAKANAKDARDLHHTVKAIADAALAATRSGSATTSKGCAE